MRPLYQLCRSAASARSGGAIVSEPFGARRLHLRRQPGMALEEPDAGVPAQHRVVVARRAQRLRFLVVVQRFEEPAGGVARMRTVPDLRLDPALADQASVVLPLVLVAQPAEDGARVAGAFPRPAAELVGSREKQHGQRLLVVGLRGKDVEADALRLLRLVEQPVSLCLGERAWNRLAGDRLELLHDASRAGPRV